MKSVISALWAEHHTLFYSLIVQVILDYITGICLAVKEKRVSSKIGAQGIAKKIMIFVLVAVSAVVDRILLSNGNALLPVTILFYCTNELISILENARTAGLPMPEKLTALLKQLKLKNR